MKPVLPLRVHKAHNNKWETCESFPFSNTTLGNPIYAGMLWHLSRLELIKKHMCAHSSSALSLLEWIRQGCQQAQIRIPCTGVNIHDVCIVHSVFQLLSCIRKALQEGNIDFILDLFSCPERMWVQWSPRTQVSRCNVTCFPCIYQYQVRIILRWSLTTKCSVQCGKFVAVQMICFDIHAPRYVQTNQF